MLSAFHFVGSFQCGSSLDRIAPPFLILALRAPSSPTQIARFIVTVVVYAIQRVSLWPWAEIRFDPISKQASVVKPLVADADASPSVAAIEPAVLVSASLLNTAPEFVYWRSSQSVRRANITARLRRFFSSQPSAGLRLSGTQHREIYRRQCSAFAPTFDASQWLSANTSRFNFFQNSQSSIDDSWGYLKAAFSVIVFTTTTDGVTSAQRRQHDNCDCAALTATLKTPMALCRRLEGLRINLTNYFEASEDRSLRDSKPLTHNGILPQGVR